MQWHLKKHDPIHFKVWIRGRFLKQFFQYISLKIQDFQAFSCIFYKFFQQLAITLIIDVNNRIKRLLSRFFVPTVANLQPAGLALHLIIAEAMTLLVSLRIKWCTSHHEQQCSNDFCVVIHSVTIFTPRAGVLTALIRKAAAKSLLISFSLLNRPYKLALGCFTDLKIMLSGDFLDFSNFHSVFSFLREVMTGGYPANRAVSGHVSIKH